MTESRSDKFYLGRLYDPTAKKLLDTEMLYDPVDLTTHAIVTGMTGSGKTGLCIAMLEEAALRGIPAIIIDPKGDLTNLMLHFPDMDAQDFEPWMDPELARREGKTTNEMAAEVAGRWKQGLADWNLGDEQLRALEQSTVFHIYTPGSNAGTPINILSSFDAPDLPWNEHREVLREKITTTVTAILGLVGLKEIDPLRSREHILLSNLLEHAWSKGNKLDLSELILQVQTPPFERLGAFPLENFFPAKERMDLALMLNNFLASPSFELWREGETLDIGNMLFTAEGKPRHSIFYLAHLNDNERMFFVTLLLGAVEAWMRSQRGTSQLRALLYFDEILGYLPAVRVPPSHPVLLRMLKQARAFGLGIVLATQNPVDVDYKALSNAGSWFIGRLQTEQDKARLMDGLQSAGGNVNASVYDRLISGLGKRVFMLHNVHEAEPRLFHTRWVLNYLAGPLMRNQIGSLNQLAASASGFRSVKETPALGSRMEESPNIAPVPEEKLPYSDTKPSIPQDVTDFFLPYEKEISQSLQAAGLNRPENIQPESIVYSPVMFAQVEVLYYSRKYNIEHTRKLGMLVQELRGSVVDWEEFEWKTYEMERVRNTPLPRAMFAPLPGWLSDGREIKALEKDLADWVYRSSAVQVKTNETLKVYAGPDQSTAQFREMCSEAARGKAEEERKKIESSYDAKLTTLQNKLKRQLSEVDEQKDEVDQRRLEEMGTHGELVLSLFSKRKRSISTSLTKRRLTEKAKNDLEQERQELEMLEKQLNDLEKEKLTALEEIQEKWAQAVNDVTEVPIMPYKKDIYIQLFGVGWLPNYLVNIDDKARLLPAY